VDVRFSNRIEDCEDLTRASHRASPHARFRKWAFLLIGIAVLALPFLGVRGVRHPDWSLWPLFPFALCFIYYGSQTPKRLARRQYGKLLSTDEYEAHISEEGIITVSPTVRTELKWEAFSRPIYGEVTVALVHGALMYVFPRRAFTDDQWQEFMHLIREHIRSKK
jgi:hypothetical protein